MNFIRELFGNTTISLDEMTAFQKDSPNIIIWAAPAMFLFVLIEYIVARSQGHHYYEKKEMLGSILVGVGNVIISLFIKTSLFLIFVGIYNLVPWRMTLWWWTLIPCYIIFDFFSYWTHNISHRLRFFWASHIVHHTGEHYNLTVSFRLSWMQYIKIIFIFPVAFMGFHPVIIFMTNQIAILFQFWVHTEYIRKLHRFFEYIFATPSNHRVHHGSQSKYINKNYGATFIIWDRLFKTYQKEEEQVIYGVTHNITRPADPLHINFHEYADICKDVRNEKSWKRKLFYIFGNPSAIHKEKQREQRKHDTATSTPQPGVLNNTRPNKTQATVCINSRSK
jgi:sterol desaturase/sphingolipid hydroxylase (fatty acid hydroxylase superfamily)